MGSGSASDFLDATAGITVQLPVNHEPELFVRAKDQAGNWSDCSEAPFEFEHDDIAPGVPVLAENPPSSPTNKPSVPLDLKVELNASVVTFTGDACQTEGTPTATENSEFVKLRLDLEEQQ